MLEVIKKMKDSEEREVEEVWGVSII